jgi:hypothetical protein
MSLTQPQFMGGNANKNDVAAAATQTFTQLMIKKKIYGVS